jgi:uncharacterized protein involved in outer membrane biogenesis
MKLDGAAVSLFSGSGTLKGFKLGNPAGFKSEAAILVGQIDLGVAPMSVFGDKVHVKHVRVNSPDITFEATGVNVLANNLSKILENVQGVAAATDTNAPAKSTPGPAQSGPGRKLQVDEFLLSGAKVRVTSTALGGKTALVTIPDIRFANLGTGPEGITAAELTKKVLDELVPKVIAAAQGALGDLTKGATDLIKNAQENPGQAVDKATKSVTDLLKKK